VSSVSSAVCTSTGEVGRGAIKVMGPSASAQTSRLLEIDHSVWKQSYNACPTVLYSIDIGSVSVFTVQIDDTYLTRLTSRNEL